MAGHPLRPAIHRRLGRPLPYQLANETRTHLEVKACKQRPSFSHKVKYETYPVLAVVSSCYPSLQGRLSTRYSPVRRSTKFPKKPFSHDLHVLSTPPAFQSEPGSNSPVKNFLNLIAHYNLYVSSYFCPTRYLIVKDLGRYCEPLTSNIKEFMSTLRLYFFRELFPPEPKSGAEGQFLSKRKAPCQPLS